MWGPSPWGPAGLAGLEGSPALTSLGPRWLPGCPLWARTGLLLVQVPGPDCLRTVDQATPLD